MRRIGNNLMELVIALAFLVILGGLLLSSCERLLCKNGEEVRDGDGSMDCTGTEFYKHCEPSTHFVCHDED